MDNSKVSNVMTCLINHSHQHRKCFYLTTDNIESLLQLIEDDIDDEQPDVTAIQSYVDAISNLINLLRCEQKCYFDSFQGHSDFILQLTKSTDNPIPFDEEVPF